MNDNLCMMDTCNTLGYVHINPCLHDNTEFEIERRTVLECQMQLVLTDSLNISGVGASLHKISPHEQGTKAILCAHADVYQFLFGLIRLYLLYGSFSSISRLCSLKEASFCTSLRDRESTSHLKF